ncbi:hypothetical protein B9479_007927 [Cryptococcus floricola]|uniref:Uncharacterized protein n=1 Tax=Cryptococcus floricola TaxID=2591691 RepID=A0A5D3AIV1_9TREE|nr:hypothetical protein B9479_007927 [Cryptococcus floricola]
MAVFSTMLISQANGCSHGSSCTCGSSSGRALSNAAAGDCSTHSGSCTCGSNGRLVNECNTNGAGVVLAALGAAAKHLSSPILSSSSSTAAFDEDRGARVFDSFFSVK